jgi:hypothetical protein
MVVYLGEAQVFVRQMPQLVQSGINAKRAAGDGIEERAELFVNGSASWVVRRRIISAAPVSTGCLRN